MRTTGDHAVVLGGSMAGVLAARALAHHHRQVTVVDRDEFPATGRHRRGVPQDRHAHALQTLGARLIERLFPGTADDLVARGAVAADWGEATMCFGGLRFPRVEAGLDLIGASRPLLEGYLRERLVGLSGVAVRERCDVHGLVLDRTGSRVTGVRVLPRDHESAEEVLHADLVVDATGRGSRLPRWLEVLGYAPPPVEETGLEVAYTTCRFPRRPDDGTAAILVGGVPPEGRRGGAAIAAEGESWFVTMAGVAGEHAPTDLDGYRAYAATLPAPDLHDLVRDREALGEPVLMRHATSRRHRYDRLERFPEGLAVVGDAVCSLNPVHGQGMAVAAAEAVALDDCLQAGPHRIGPRTLAAASQVVEDAWDMTWSRDALFVPELRSGRSRPVRLADRYRARLVAVAAHDPEVCRAFREVLAMVARPQSLARPGVAGRVLTSRWRRRPPRPETTGRVRAACELPASGQQTP